MNAYLLEQEWSRHTRLPERMRMPWSELQSSSWAEGQFEKPMKALKIPVDQSSAGKTKHNSLAERNNQFLLLATTTCLLEAGIPPCFWKYASHRHDSFSLVFSWMKKLAVGLCLGSGCRSEFFVSACALQAHELASQTTRRRVARCMWVCPRIGAPISSQAQRSCDCQRLCLSCMPSLRCKFASGSWHQEAIHESPRACCFSLVAAPLWLFHFPLPVKASVPKRAGLRRWLSGRRMAMRGPESDAIPC